MLKNKRFKWIIFDIGGVCVDVDFSETIVAFSKISGESVENTEIKLRKIGKTETQHSAIERLSVGAISDKKYLQTICTAFENKISQEQLKLLHENEIREPFSETYELIDQLKSEYKVCCFSNSISFHWNVLIKKKYLDVFEIKMASHIAKVRKPNINSYKAMIEQLQTTPNQCIFIDDREENITAATEFGIKSILFTSPNQLKNDFHKHLGS